MIVDMISSLGRSVIKFFRALGRSGFMLFGALVGKPQIRQHFPLLVKQLYALGVQSLLIILLSGLFIGMVLGLQGYVVLVDFSAETSLGQLVALSLLRELGPVVTALLFAGRAGSALTAEIGLMKALGAYQWQIALLFYCEAIISALIGGLLGCIAGWGLARFIGAALFGVPLSFAWIVVPCVLVLSILIALVGTWFPAHRIAKLYPVEVLYGR